MIAFFTDRHTGFCTGSTRWTYTLLLARNQPQNQQDYVNQNPQHNNHECANARANRGASLAGAQVIARETVTVSRRSTHASNDPPGKQDVNGNNYPCKQAKLWHLGPFQICVAFSQSNRKKW